jgi:hypothetical protein
MSVRWDEGVRILDDAPDRPRRTVRVLLTEASRVPRALPRCATPMRGWLAVLPSLQI